MGFIAAADPASKVAYQFTNTGQLAHAIQDYGYIPLRTTGEPFTVQMFEGGYLLDGAPINVWMGDGWYAGQQELLRPYWSSGSIPTPPADVLGAVVVAMPPDLAAQTAAAHGAGGLLDNPLVKWGLIAAGVYVLANVAFPKGGASKLLF